jgi:chromosome segregation ATPase
MLLFLENLTAWKDSGVWAPVIATVAITVLATWLMVRYWFKHKLSAMEEKYLSALSRYERTKESYNSLAYNNAALRSDRNRWEEEREEIVAEREGLLQKIEQLEREVVQSKAKEGPDNQQITSTDTTTLSPSAPAAKRSKKTP